jgi:protein-S-isoprenylcysteine O-methyltransferase Ste14
VILSAVVAAGHATSDAAALLAVAYVVLLFAAASFLDSASQTTLELVIFGLPVALGCGLPVLAAAVRWPWVRDLETPSSRPGAG